MYTIGCPAKTMQTKHHFRITNNNPRIIKNNRSSFKNTFTLPKIN